MEPYAKICLTIATVAGGILCFSGLMEMLVSLWFISHLHPVHLILQIAAGVCALISGVWGVAFSRSLSRRSHSAGVTGIRAGLLITFFLQGIALALLLLDKAGYNILLKKIFPEHKPPVWSHTAKSLPRCILALSVGDSISMLMEMIVWTCTLSCIHASEQDLSSVTITSARWVWKGNDTTCPGSTADLAIKPMKAIWKHHESPAVMGSYDPPNCRPTRKFSFKQSQSYNCNDYQSKTGRTPASRMSSFKPLLANKKEEQNTPVNHSDKSSCSPTAAISSTGTARRTPKKITGPTTPIGYVPYNELHCHSYEMSKDTRRAYQNKDASGYVPFCFPKETASYVPLKNRPSNCSPDMQPAIAEESTFSADGFTSPSDFSSSFPSSDIDSTTRNQSKVNNAFESTRLLTSKSSMTP